MKVNASFYLTIITLVYVLTIFLVFIGKEKIKNLETKNYFYLLIITLICSISEILLALLYEKGFFIMNLCMKLFLICCILWGIRLLRYLLIIIYGKPSKKSLILIYSSALVIILIMLFLKVDYIYDNNVLIYTQGPCVYLGFGYAGAILLSMIILLIINNKIIKEKKCMPILLFVLLITIVLLIQNYNPKLLLINLAFGLTVFLMYNTIENPDMKLVEYEKKEKEKAIATAESKTEFLSSMSHELRTPLNAIVGLSEDINTFESEINEDAKEDTNDLIIAANNLLDVISSILDASKIESNKLDVVECDYDPKIEYQDVIDKFKYKAIEKGLEFNFNMSESVPSVLYGDKLRIKQIVKNLVSNAVKFTDKGKISVDIGWFNNTDNLYIRIADTGNGMPKDEVDYIFSNDDIKIEKIYSVQGAGLGLTITKNLVKILGGKIEVDSSFAGTIYDIVIPQKIGSKEELDKLNQVVEIDYSKIDFTGMKLLVVDDNKLNIKVLRKAIKDYNFEIDECYNGKEAIDKIEFNNNYDLVLMDIMMPEMGGEEAITILKAKPNFKTPVIALTADGNTGASTKYIKMGFNDFMSKPFTREMVARKLIQTLK